MVRFQTPITLFALYFQVYVGIATPRTGLRGGPGSRVADSQKGLSRRFGSAPGRVARYELGSFSTIPSCLVGACGLLAPGAAPKSCS
jgi:hypothetical protein